MRLSIAILIVCSAATAQTTSKENEVRDRGQTPARTTPQMRQAGHTQINQAKRKEVIDMTGLLVDAGCKDREMASASAPPEPNPINKKSADREGAGAEGVHVAPNVMEAERSDAMEHQVPDLATRQMDPNCAITGETKAFALVLPGGRMLNLDEGGNTKALEAFQSTPAGRDVLNGKSRGEKPKATVHGSVRGDRIVVQSIRM